MLIKRVSTLWLCVLLFGALVILIIYIITRSILFPNEFKEISIATIQLQNIGTSKEKSQISKLCVAVYGTTIDDENKIELIELLNIYKNNDDVYFFLDDLNNEMDYKLCDILSSPDRCIWHDADYKKIINLPEEHYRKYLLTYKTMIVFTLIKEMRLYDRCEYIMKLDSDAYVDVNRFGDWLSHTFDHSNDVYLGKTCFCFADGIRNRWENRDYEYMMSQGTYTLSSGIFANRPWLEFNNETMVEHVMEDCSMSYLLMEQLHINHTDIGHYVVYGWNETENRELWNELPYFERQCRFWCHKCVGKFREEFVKDTSYIPLHVDHCRFKAYEIGWSTNGSEAVEHNFIRVEGNTAPESV